MCDISVSLSGLGSGRCAEEPAQGSLDREAKRNESSRQNRTTEDTRQRDLP